MILTGVIVLRLIVADGSSMPDLQDPCPPVQSGEPIAFCRLDPKPLRRSDQRPPAYPPALRTVGVGGIAHVRFVLDSNGRVQPSTITILPATNRAFVESVIAVLGSGRFEVPSYRGAAVSARLDLEAEFVAPNRDPKPVRSLWSEERTASGYRWRIGWEAIPRTVPAPILEPATRDSIARAVILAVPIRASLESKRALCIGVPPAWHSAAVDKATIAELRPQRRNTVPVSRCPRTYEGYHWPGSPVRPRGALDPDLIVVDSVLAWTPEIVYTRVTTRRGVSGEWRSCDAVRDPLRGHGWAITCRVSAIWSEVT